MKQSRYGRLKRKAIVVGSILGVWLLANLAWHLRPQTVTANSITENHQICGQNLWLLRWKYGWENASRTEEKDAVKSRWISWPIEGGGQLEVRFAPQESIAQEYYARYKSPMTSAQVVLHGQMPLSKK